ncbi:MAG: O-antigen ligase family protein [Bacteroidia bacterium]|nr:O-antigen ligase family protein [Bacteroidota bacterium]MBK7430755.1 O-antigen ligase family protein [Bacteroidota bacterium]MBP9789524.1 O-antigen ligase family protein [Bacteroidia bacterium]MBP9923429.1 O-antigen ligase family protein [Bacteroidia bacterium]
MLVPLSADLSNQATDDFRSNRIDRILIFILVFSIYFESNLPLIYGASTPFLLFGLTLFYLAVTRLKTLIRLFSGKYFLISISFAIICVFMETLHPFPSYDFISRYVNMIIGMFCIVALCRDRMALDIALFTFILASAVQSFLIITGTAPLMQNINAVGFSDASQARLMAFEEFYLRGNLNDISYFSSIGSIIGIIWAYYEKVAWKKWLLVALTFPSILGVFLPASRTGAVIFFASFLLFIYKSKIKFKKWALAIPTLLILLAFTVPDMVWVRLGSLIRITELQEEDSRTKVYIAVLKNVNQYFITGVGSGNYWHGWAVNAGITNRFTTDVAMAAHNAFFQVWIYWGLPALIAFLYLMSIYRDAIVRDIAGDRRRTCIYIFIMIIPMIFLFYHSFYHKSFSIGLGLLLSARYWNLLEQKETLS